MALDPKQAFVLIEYDDPTLAQKAQELTLRFDRAFCPPLPFSLYLDHERCALKFGPRSLLYPDFHLASVLRSRGLGKKRSLLRACKPKSGMKIIDACAGWGKDAAILASYGAQVLMIERHPLLSFLLEDALERQDAEDKKALSLSLHQGDAFVYLEGLKADQYPDLIYLDPMHPSRDKSALVKQEMQVLQQLISEDKALLALIELARARARFKVVLKWPQKKQAPLKADASIPGKTVRFDLFTPLDKGH